MGDTVRSCKKVSCAYALLHTRTPSIRRWRPPWISKFFKHCRDELRLHIKEALAIQHHRPQLNRCDEDMGTGFLIWNALCCLSQPRSSSRYLCADNVAIYLHFLSNWLVILSLSHELFLPFFVFSFLPSILSLPGAASTWTWQRLSSLVCTCVPRSFSRHAWFLNPDFSSAFSQTDNGVDAETFFVRPFQ